MDDKLNPIYNIYSSFLLILKNMTIKYTGIAEDHETTESRGNADGYFDALYERDTFYTYSQYSVEEMSNVGIPEDDMHEYLMNPRLIPKQYRADLLRNRRKYVIDNFEEKNNYYRMLNGLPDIGDKDFFYCSDELAKMYNFDNTIPLHLLQDEYNKKEKNLGDYILTCIEGSGFIDGLIKEHPEKEYLTHLGTNRIDLYKARNAKNFTMIHIKNVKVKYTLLEMFKDVYEQARGYFIKVIYIPTYRKIIDFYDNFIAMCIMVMTVQQICVRQMGHAIRREFFDVYAIKELYKAYNVPYDININEDIQDALIKNLNLIIQHKATDKFIFNLIGLLGFVDVDIYKYYLIKARRYDAFGVPIVAYTERFNADTGYMETVPDYKAMYDIYFSKVNIQDVDQSGDILDPSNRVDYADVTTGDPFWMEDESLYKMLWETEYNIVESKYLSLGISYSMTELMFDNIFFIKLIMQNKDALSDVYIELPKITGKAQIPLFDVILLMMSVISCKHNIYGEVITVPSQVFSVLDYVKNSNGDPLTDTLKFNFNYFFRPQKKDKENPEFNKMKDGLIDYMKDMEKDPIARTFMVDTHYFDDLSPEELSECLSIIKSIFTEEDYEKFLTLIAHMNMDDNNVTPQQKVDNFNAIYNGVKSLYKLVSYYLSIEDDREQYEQLRRIYDGLFYAREMAETFTITTHSGVTRTAWTYAECLYYTNPQLYNAVFKIDYEKEYNDYIENQGLDVFTYTFDDFMKDVYDGNLMLNYATLKDDDGDLSQSEKDNILYDIISHIITRMEMTIKNLDFLYLFGDMTSPLEDLLVKLVKFFKSFTVDLIGMETIFICDFDTENTFRLFDEIGRIEKTDMAKDYLRLTYSDVIDRMVTELHPTEKLSFRDIMLYNAHVIFGEDDFTRTPIVMREDIKYHSTLQTDEEKQYLVDSADISSDLHVGDGMKLQDRIYAIIEED